jgi:hypothetical protein
LVNKFKNELYDKLDLIFKFCYVSSLNDIKDSKLRTGEYFYKFIEERIIDGVKYTLYYYKGLDKKRLYVAFKNGIRVNGNERKRVIKILGYGKYNWRNKRQVE